MQTLCLDPLEFGTRRLGSPDGRELRHHVILVRTLQRPCLGRGGMCEMLEIVRIGNTLLQQVLYTASVTGQPCQGPTFSPYAADSVLLCLDFLRFDNSCTSLLFFTSSVSSNHSSVLADLRSSLLFLRLLNSIELIVKNEDAGRSDRSS